jgi:dihydrodipicolinate synthase/N-acetylneuraminate lyase
MLIDATKSDYQGSQSMIQSSTKLTRSNLRGVWAALITAWSDDDTLDESGFERHVRRYASLGVHGVYTGGTTGEFYAQDDNTFERVTRIACQSAHQVGVPVQIGCTALCTRTAIGRAKFAVAAGADAIQIALPFWLALKNDEAVSFLYDVAQAVFPTPLVLYHTDRAKFKFNPTQIAELASRIPTLIGTKDGGCDLDALDLMHKLVPDLAIFGGEGDMTTRMARGGRGTYSSVVGLSPRTLLKLFTLCESDQFSQAQQIQTAIHGVIHEVALLWVKRDGLWDSALDRIFYAAGGGEVGLRCQSPLRSGNVEHVREMTQWCQKHAPYLVNDKIPLP